MVPRRSFLTTVSVILIALGMVSPASGQCILSNPSFEVAGTGGAVFGGWNQFGVFGVVGVATHGSKAARVTGPNTGAWDVSGYWQSQDCQAGEQWRATGHVMHPSSKPLTGQNIAMVNIEWRDSGGNLIDYDSFSVADASSAADEYTTFSVLSNPAPAGTAETRILLGVLQSPDDPPSDVYYDQVTFESTTPPTTDDIQWNDFPGNRTISFAGRDWRVKGPGVYGPGTNYFCDASDCVWTDGNGWLHLTLKNRSGTWASTEVTAVDTLGYGDYIVTTVGRLDLLDVEAVLGIFLWQYGPCWDPGYLWWNPYNEIDIEYSRWENPGSAIAQFVAQPYDWGGNLHRFDMAFSDGEVVSHAMRWLPDRVEYRVWRGGPDEESAATLVQSWTYTGPHIPRPEQPRMHLNLWRNSGTPASNQEVVFQDFRFVPEGTSTAVEGGGRVPARAAGWLYPAVPNPFNPSTTLRFHLERPAAVELAIYSLDGRRVRTLLKRRMSEGEHRILWDGRDDAGRDLASGVYLYRLRGEGFNEARRAVLLK